MIATGIPIPTARSVARRRVRSRSNCPTADGPTPRTGDVAEPGTSISSSLLGFADFGAETVEKRAVGFESRVPGEQRVRDFVGLEQQRLALVGRRRVRAAPEVSLGPLGVPVRQADHGQPASLPPVLLRIAAPALLVRAEGVAILARQEKRMTEV